MPGTYYQNNKTTRFLRVKYLTWRRAPCLAVNDRTVPFFKVLEKIMRAVYVLYTYNSMIYQ